MHANAINEIPLLSFAHDQAYMPGLDLTGSDFLFFIFHYLEAIKSK